MVELPDQAAGKAEFAHRLIGHHPPFPLLLAKLGVLP
jgi:hypothetical protein